MIYNPKENLQAWTPKKKSNSRANITTFLSITAFLSLTLFTSACSHKFAKLETSKNTKIINQTLKVKIYKNDSIDKLTIYTQVDRDNKRAILDGTGKFDKYVFHMEIEGNKYYFEDYINNEKKDGRLEDFDLVSLKQDDIFERIDINRPQPIIFTSNEKNIKVEITVKEQN
jgi:hypothetical protein